MNYEEIKFWIVFVVCVLILDNWITEFLNTREYKRGIK